ncbi:MAG: K(+)-transporting ATPase subunit F, partial [Mesorhizobium sp.]
LLAYLTYALIRPERF